MLTSNTTLPYPTLRPIQVAAPPNPTLPYPILTHHTRVGPATKPYPTLPYPTPCYNTLTLPYPAMCWELKSRHSPLVGGVALLQLLCASHFVLSSRTL